MCRSDEPRFEIRADRPTKSTCWGCSASIVWVMTVLGKRMPLDRYAVTLEDERRWVVSADSHWATCSQSGPFRQKRAARLVAARAGGTTTEGEEE